MNHVLRQTLIIASLGMVITVNALANILPINNITTGELSDQFAILFVPAGYVFSIWGVIYLGLLAYAIFQALPKQKSNERLIKIAPWFLVNAIANSLWIFAWHYEAVALSVIIMLVILASLIKIYLDLRSSALKPSNAERWAVFLPFSIYLGWITVATVANVSVLLFKSGWAGFGLSDLFWASLLTLIAVALAVFMLYGFKDIAYAGVLIWAFAGIAIKHWQVYSFANVALLATLIIAALVLFTVIKKPNNLKLAGA